MKIRDFTLEIMNKKGLTEKPQSLSIEQMELVWAETSDELRKLISLKEVIESSMKRDSK